MSEVADQHRGLAKGQSAACAVLTVSDTRHKADDKSGRIIIETLESAGHTVMDYQIVRDEPDEIEKQLRHWLSGDRFDAICTTGGTGIARRDTTIEVVRRLIEKELEGFGELFRTLSWQEIQAAAMLSRAVAGLAGETFIFAMPGSSNAVKLAMTQLVVPELPHLVWQRKGS